MIKNILIKFLFQNKSEELNLLFKIYYLIIFLFTFTILTSLISSHSIYLMHNVSDRQNFINTPIDEKYKKKINQNDFSVNKILTSEILSVRLDHQLFDIDYIKKSKKVPNVIISKFPDDFKNIYSSKLRKELFIKVALPIIVKENEHLVAQNIKIEQYELEIIFENNIIDGVVEIINNYLQRYEISPIKAFEQKDNTLYIYTETGWKLLTNDHYLVII